VEEGSGDHMMQAVDFSILPKITLILFSYNQSRFISEAAKSCLAQDYAGPLEIMFSDDCSLDNTFDILKKLAEEYDGPHLIRVRRNSINQGIGAHYNTVIAEASGELILTAAGDDISMPSRVQRVVEAWLANGRQANLITSNLRQIDVHGELGQVIIVSDLGRWKNPREWIRKRPYVVGAAHAFTPRLHREFGNFLPELVYEDQVMAMRAAMIGGGLKVDEVLVLYRSGGVSQSKGSIRNATDYLQWARKNFNRQAAQYSQISRDLLTKNLGELINGRIHKKQLQAEFVILLDQASGIVAKIIFALCFPHCGLFFKWKMLVYLSFPAFAAFIQRRQRNLHVCKMKLSS
jgi:glycosyltransferase involved in cell wall biosynthesis